MLNNQTCIQIDKLDKFPRPLFWCRPVWTPQLYEQLSDEAYNVPCTNDAPDTCCENELP